MSYFPMFVELEGKSCLIAGGGRVALRKAEMLLSFGADVTVVAPEILPEIESLHGVSCHRRPLEGGDIKGRALVVAATGDADTNRRVSKACMEFGIPVNAVDQAADSSFIFPAYLKEGEVVAAFSSGGRSPVLARHLKEQARPLITPLIGELASCLGSVRAFVRERVGSEEARKKIYQEILRLGLEKEAVPSEREIEQVIGAYLDLQDGEAMDEKSRQLFEEAKEHIPGGVNSPVRAFTAMGRTPRFIASAHGSRMTDADGNEMIDYVCSWGPGILGHAHPRVVEKAREACLNGLTYGAPTENEVLLAKMIAEMVPSMEVSRLVSSGTEAVMSAVRVARGFTGRDRIIKFRGCYHGHSDGLLVKAGSGALTASMPDSAGVPRDYVKNTLVAEYNDTSSVEALFQAHPESIAAVLVEPVAANMGVALPQPGFLEFLRDITRRQGALLIFDEVITGFRLAQGGAQEYYGVTPDLTTLGKIVGGGMPLGAYGGRREIMQMVSPEGPVYQAGTLSGNPVATAAGIETLRILREDEGIYRRLSEKAKRIEDAVREAAGGRVCVNRAGSLLSVFFTPEQVTDYESALTSDTAKYADYFGYLLDHGIYMAPSQFEAMFVSDAHSDGDIEYTCRIIKECFRNSSVIADTAGESCLHE